MVKNFEDMFIRFDRIHERDRQTQTDRQTPHDKNRQRLRSTARQKRWKHSVRAHSKPSVHSRCFWCRSCKKCAVSGLGGSDVKEENIDVVVQRSAWDHTEDKDMEMTSPIQFGISNLQRLLDVAGHLCCSRRCAAECDARCNSYAIY